ncbi:Hypothetical predicted protein [Pelobates cultripes]|uniref:Uncharacterized protein n=1 Tax=Pelobates cultripes TaxID=61616 RepID=A0AAD1RX84_PELCU|nr:Hypothetical predicted protein [Pelobates cultripes]
MAPELPLIHTETKHTTAVWRCNNLPKAFYCSRLQWGNTPRNLGGSVRGRTGISGSSYPSRIGQKWRTSSMPPPRTHYQLRKRRNESWRRLYLHRGRAKCHLHDGQNHSWHKSRPELHGHGAQELLCIQNGVPERGSEHSDKTHQCHGRSCT